MSWHLNEGPCASQLCAVGNGQVLTATDVNKYPVVLI